MEVKMKYYVICNGGGDTYVREFTKEELLAELDDGAWSSDEILEKIESRDTSYWGEKILIIKGEIVTPMKKEVGARHDLP